MTTDTAVWAGSRRVSITSLLKRQGMWIAAAVLIIAVHAMNAIAADKLPVPLPVLPLVGGVTGLVFGVLFGSVSTRRGGTAFAMISLGLGELIASLSLILRGFFGGEAGGTADRKKM